jgi:hypothetical protein
MKTNITNNMLVFKDAVRHIWNTYFVTTGDAMSPEIQSAYSKIEEELFYTIVIFPLGISQEIQYRKEPISSILVKPKQELSEYPVYIGYREENGNLVWEEKTICKDKNFIFNFYDFFDWDIYGYIDLPYVRGKIIKNDFISTKNKKNLVFMEQSYCEFLFDDENITM